jgi:hypothetical protein
MAEKGEPKARSGIKVHSSLQHYAAEFTLCKQRRAGPAKRREAPACAVGSVFFALIFICYFLFIKEKKVKAD